MAIVVRNVPSNAITAAVRNGSRKRAASTGRCSARAGRFARGRVDSSARRRSTSSCSRRACSFWGVESPSRASEPAYCPVRSKTGFTDPMIQTRVPSFPNQLHLLAIFEAELSLSQILLGHRPARLIEELEDRSPDHLFLRVAEEARHSPIHEAGARLRVDEPDALRGGLEHGIGDRPTQPLREGGAGVLFRNARPRLRAQVEVSVVTVRHGAHDT